MLRLSFVMDWLRKGPVGQALDPTVSGVGGAYIKDIVCGATDGIVTTFAVVAAGAGAHLSLGVIILLGFATLLADGFSMAAGTYPGAKSERELAETGRGLTQDRIV